MECQMTFQMTCFCAVSLSGTMWRLTITVQAQRGRDLLVAHSSDCHLCDGEEFLRGQDLSRCENAYKNLGFMTPVAVVHRCVSRVWCFVTFL